MEIADARQESDTAMNSKLRQNLRTSGNNFGEEGEWSPAMALDASQIGTRLKNHS